MTASEQKLQEHRFGNSPALTMGVEEELLLVDDARRLAPQAEEVIEAVGEDLRGSISTEIFATQIELKTGICRDCGQALEELARLRRTIAERGYTLIGSGIHPDDGERPTLVESPRYEVVKEDLASLLTTPPAAFTSTSACPTPKPRSASATPCATTCRCCRR